MLELAKTGLFRDIQQESIVKMMKCTGAVTREYMPEEYIFREEDKPEYLYLVLEGKVLVIKDFVSGRQDILYAAAEGEVFGEVFFESGQTGYWFNAVAQTKTTVLLLPWRFFFGFCSNACEHHQQINRNMLEILSFRNFYMAQKAHILSGVTLREKISVWLLENMKDGKVEMTMNREQMAAYLGVTRPSLSRELMKMQREGIIELDKKEIRVPDISRLGE